MADRLPHEPTDAPVSFASGLYTQHACVYCGEPYSSKGECPARLRAALDQDRDAMAALLTMTGCATLAGVGAEVERLRGVAFELLTVLRYYADDKIGDNHAMYARAMLAKHAALATPGGPDAHK